LGSPRGLLLLLLAPVNVEMQTALVMDTLHVLDSRQSQASYAGVLKLQPPPMTGLPEQRLRAHRSNLDKPVTMAGNTIHCSFSTAGHRRMSAQSLPLFQGVARPCWCLQSTSYCQLRACCCDRASAMRERAMERGSFRSWAAPWQRRRTATWSLPGRV